jgi:uncharacterized membrane protein required for colicin V production
MLASTIKVAIVVLCVAGMVMIMPLITPDSPGILDHNLGRFNRFAMGFLICRVVVFGLLFTVGWRITHRYFRQYHALDLSSVRVRWGVSYLLIETMILLQILRGVW